MIGIDKIVFAVHRNSFFIVSTVIFIQIFSPYTFIGTTSTILGEALPHCIAGNLTLLTLGYLLIGRYNQALVTSCFVTLFHVQHGVIVALFILVSLFIQRPESRNFAKLLFAFSLNILLISAYLYFRSFLGNVGDFAQVCSQLIPMHCEANAWPGTWLLRFAAGAILVLMYLFVFGKHSKLRTFCAILGVLLAICTIAILMDYLNIPILGSLAQATNSYRFGVPLITLIPLCLVLLIAHTLQSKENTARLASFSSFWILAVGSFYIFPTLTFNKYLIGFFFLNAVLCVELLRRRNTKHLLIAVVCVFTFIGSFFWINKSNIAKSNLVFGSPYYRNFDSLAQVIPVGSVVLVDPLGGQYFRLASTRAIFVDCKYKPYGGSSLREYLRRINLLGGFDSICGNYGYKQLSLRKIEDIAVMEEIDFMLFEKSSLSDVTFKQFSVVNESTDYLLLKRDVDPYG